MPPLVEVKLRGFDELERALEQIPARAQKSALRNALRAAGKIWQSAMESLVRRGEHHGKGKGAARVFGWLAQHIAISVSAAGNLAATLKAGPDKSAPWGKFLEFGTGPRLRGNQTGGRQLTGRARMIAQRLLGENRMPAYPFVRPAFDETEDEILEALRVNLRQELIDEGIPLQ
jgi:HK97 gp10 family phage protein